MLESLVLSYAAGLGLTAARIAGFVVVSPVPGESTPAQTRVGLVVVLSALVSLVVTEPPAPLASVGAVAIRASFELGLGLLIGLTFRLVLTAGDVLGNAVSQATGQGAASLFDPETASHETPIERVMALFTMLLAISVGAHRIALSYLLESFRALPVGRPLPLAASAPLLTEIAGNAIYTGVRLAMPVIAVSLAVQLVLAMVGRAAPSLQIFSVGFTILALAGLVLLGVSLRPMALSLVEHIGSLREDLERLLLGLSAG